MTNNTDQELKKLQSIISQLEKRISMLERENNRRKSEINQITSAVRKG